MANHPEHFDTVTHLLTSFHVTAATISITQQNTAADYIDNKNNEITILITYIYPISICNQFESAAMQYRYERVVFGLAIENFSFLNIFNRLARSLFVITNLHTTDDDDDDDDKNGGKIDGKQ